MTLTARELARKRPAQIVAARPQARPAHRDRSGGWVIAFVVFGLPILFIIAAGLGWIAAR